MENIPIDTLQFQVGDVLEREDTTFDIDLVFVDGGRLNAAPPNRACSRSLG